MKRELEIYGSDEFLDEFEVELNNAGFKTDRMAVACNSAESKGAPSVLTVKLRWLFGFGTKLFSKTLAAYIKNKGGQRKLSIRFSDGHAIDIESPELKDFPKLLKFANAIQIKRQDQADPNGPKPPLNTSSH